MKLWIFQIDWKFKKKKLKFFALGENSAMFLTLELGAKDQHCIKKEKPMLPKNIHTYQQKKGEIDKKSATNLNKNEKKKKNTKHAGRSRHSFYVPKTNFNTFAVRLSGAAAAPIFSGCTNEQTETETQQQVHRMQQSIAYFLAQRERE